MELAGTHNRVEQEEPRTLNISQRTLPCPLISGTLSRLLFICSRRRCFLVKGVHMTHYKCFSAQNTGSWWKELITTEAAAGQEDN